MKASFLFLSMLFICFCGCKQNDKQPDSPNPIIPSVDTIGKLTIKDKNKYSPLFLDKLNKKAHSDYELIDSLFINGKDTSFFPTDLPLNKLTTFVGSKNNRNFTLSLKRVNYTRISYQLQVEPEGSIYTGDVILSETFFMNSEIDKDDKSGTSYSSSEYLGVKDIHNCRIRIGKNSEGKLCAKIVLQTSYKPNEITLDNCPTLYAQQMSL